MTDRADVAVPVPRASDDEVGFPPRRRAWTIVAVLAVINVTALLDRFLPAVLMDPIKHDLRLSDTSVSLIQGYAFAIFYCLAGLPLARLIDRGNRRNLIVAAVLAWSVMTIGCGLASTYLLLFISRAGVGIAEAVLAPCAYSIIADCFPRRLRGRAIGIVYGSQSIGSSASFVLGGLLFGRLSHAGGLHLAALGTLSPWRATFIIAALPGLVAAVAAFTFREPQRREIDGTGQTESLLPFLKENMSCLLPLYTTFGLLGFVTLIGPSWATAFYTRIHGLPLARAGFVVGLTLLVAGMLGPILSGIIGDYLAAVRPGSRFRLPLFSLLIGIPTFALWPLLPSGLLSYGMLGFSVTVLSLGLSSAPAILQEISPNSLRARVLAVNQTVQIITSGFSPTAVALVTDKGFGSPMALPYSIVLCAIVGGVLALLACLATSRPYARVFARSSAALREPRAPNSYLSPA